MIKINIANETGKLSAVVVGIANDFGGAPKLEECYDPKSKAHITAGTYPVEKDCIHEIRALVAVFERHGVEVFRPKNINGVNQIFTRDIAFVIADKLVLPNIIENRKEEISAIDDLISQIPSELILKMPADARVEGGDVMPWNEYVFAGYSEKEDFEKYTVARTNRAGLNFLKDTFPNKKVKGFELNKSDVNPRENALHLDCCFQPIGKNSAIMYRGGFKNEADINFLVNYFGAENIIEISKEEMYNMNSNVFSISEQVIVSEKGFTRLNTELRKRGLIVEEIPYAEIAKMEGLLRCSTIPLIRD
jgi:N-dimethylarginine dimethylaminohydrolase